MSSDARPYLAATGVGGKTPAGVSCSLLQSSHDSRNDVAQAQARTSADARGRSVIFLPAGVICCEVEKIVLL